MSGKKIIDGLKEAIEHARTVKMTPEQIRAQRISFVYGQLMDTAPHITKEDIARIHDETYGVPSKAEE